jgi:hypothetical protein
MPGLLRTLDVATPGTSGGRPLASAAGTSGAGPVPTAPTGWRPGKARQKRSHVFEEEEEKRYREERQNSLLITMNKLSASASASAPVEKVKNEDDSFCEYLSIQLRKLSGNAKFSVHGKILAVVGEALVDAEI